MNSPAFVKQPNTIWGRWAVSVESCQICSFLSKINNCCFKSQSFGVICYAAIDKWNKILPYSPSLKHIVEKISLCNKTIQHANTQGKVLLDKQNNLLQMYGISTIAKLPLWTANLWIQTSAAPFLIYMARSHVFHLSIIGSPLPCWPQEDSYGIGRVSSIVLVYNKKSIILTYEGTRV